MSTDSRVVAVQPPREVAPMTVMGLLERRQMVQTVIEEVMVEGVHYGIIPGTQEMSLLKEGAEVLLSTFHIAVEPIVTDLSTPTEVRFRVECRGTHMGTQGYVGSGVGVCSSNEEKYRWRKARSKAEYEAAAPEHKRIKYGRSKGGQEYQDQQVRQSPWDAYQTINAMATKRGMVALAKTALAASECLKRAKLKQRTPPQNVGTPAGNQTGTPAANATRTPEQQAKTAGTTPNGKKPTDPSRPATPPQDPPLIDQHQVNTLYTRIDDTGIPENAFLARFELGRVEDLDAARYDAGLAWINANAP